MRLSVGGQPQAPSPALTLLWTLLPPPVGAAQAVALAGGEVGQVHGLHVGLGVGSCAALRLCSAGPAAEQRRAGQAMVGKLILKGPC